MNLGPEPLTGPPSAATLAAGLALLKVTLVLLTALALTFSLRRASAGVRHLVWFVTFGAMLVMPFVSAWGPVSWRVLPQMASVTHETQTTESAASPVLTETAKPSVPAVSSTAPMEPVRAHAMPLMVSTGALLLAAWVLGVLFLLGRLALGAWSVRRIVRSARVLDHDAWRQPLYEIADRLGLRDAPELLQSDRISIPFASGLWHCHIVLPAESEEWSAERRSAVLMHELGHVRRRDLVGHTLSRIVCALYWFHPLVWTGAQRLRAESERACDDLVLGLGARPADYAEHLLDIVSTVRDHRTPAVALAMANPNEFEGRMLAILDPRVRRRGPGRAQAAGLAGSLALLALIVGATTPTPRTTAMAAEPARASESKPVTRTVTSTVEHTSRTQVTHERKQTYTPKPGKDSRDWIAETDASYDEALALAAKGSNAQESQEADASQRVAVLAKTLRTDTSPEVRRVAAWGLERYADSDPAVTALAAAVETDAAEEVREMSAWALSGSYHNAAAVAALQKAIQKDKSRAVRRTATWACGETGDPSSVAVLVGVLADADPEIREMAAWSIGSCEPEKAPPALVRLLSDPHRDVRLSTAWALMEIGDEETADELEAAFSKEKDSEVQHGLIRALGSMGDVSVATLTRLVGSPDPEIRAVAITALAGGHTTGPWPWPRPEPRPYP
jgi:beta-lactamase regulating signal transducer with metallopeptidase domain/HEAT repeat protein